MDEPHLLTSPLCARDLRGEWSRRTRQSLCRSSSLLAHTAAVGAAGLLVAPAPPPSDERHRQRSVGVGRPLLSLRPRPRDGSLPARRREVIFRNHAHPYGTRGRPPRRVLAASTSVGGGPGASSGAAGGARGDAAAAAVVAAAGPSRGAATLRPGSILLELSVFDGRLKRHEFVVRGEQTLDQVRAAAPARPARPARSIAPRASRRDGWMRRVTRPCARQLAARLGCETDEQVGFQREQLQHIRRPPTPPSGASFFHIEGAFFGAGDADAEVAAKARTWLDARAAARARSPAPGGGGRGGGGGDEAGTARWTLMGATSFESLRLHLGERYLFLHHGDCEHGGRTPCPPSHARPPSPHPNPARLPPPAPLPPRTRSSRRPCRAAPRPLPRAAAVVFTACRTLGPLDDCATRAYPALSWLGRSPARTCAVCEDAAAAFEAHGDPHADRSPCMLCPRCR